MDFSNLTHEDDIGEDVSNHRSFFYPSALDSPLLDTEYILLSWALTKGPRPARLASSVRTGWADQFIAEIKSRHPRSVVSAPMSNHVSLLCDRIRGIGRVDLPIRDKYTVAADGVWDNLVESLTKKYGPTSLKPASATDREFLNARPDREKYYEVLWGKMNRAVWKLQEMSLAGDQTSIVTLDLSPIGLRCYVSSRWMAIVVYSDNDDSPKVYLCPGTCFMMWHNVITTRHQTYLANRILSRIPDVMLDSVFEWQERIIRYGNDGYEVVKALESLSKCWLSRLSGGDPTARGAYDRLKGKITDRLTKVVDTSGVDQPRLVALEEMNRLESILRTASISQTAEIFGLQKTIGFPVVCVLEGAKKVHKGAAEDSILSPWSIIQIEWIYCHLTLKNFVARTGSWPNLTFTREGTKLERLYSTAAPTIHDDSYPIHEWAYAVFGAMYHFDQMDDLTPLILDKACSPGLEELKKKYQHQGPDASRTRVITATLTSGVRAAETLSSYAAKEYKVDRPCLIIKPKEKEFKVAPRMYTILPVKWRYPLGIIQENVKHGPFRDLPYQTMTLSRNEQQHHLWKLLSPPPVTRGGERCARIYIEIDFESWNNKFRHELVSRVGRRMDQQHGVEGVFGLVHEFFQSARVVLNSSGERVSILEAFDDIERDRGQTWWEDHKGGIEGIDQATWTAITICMIYMAIGFGKYQFSLVGQGDNQVLCVDLLAVPESDKQTIGDETIAIMARIESIATFLNHTAKPDEFLESTTVFTYSKQVFVNGAEVPVELKYTGKIGPYSSSERLSVIEQIGAIWSGASASADRADQPLLHYRLALIMMAQTLRAMEHGTCVAGDPLPGWLHMATQMDLHMLMTVPSVFGGFPVLSPTAFMIRGEPDSLGSALAGLRLTEGVSPSFGKVMEYLSRPSSWRKVDTDVTTSLIRDPESIPLKRLAGGSRLIEDGAMANLSSITCHPDYQEVFGSETDEKQVLRDIAAMEPMYPHLAADIYKISKPGISRKYAKKFAYSRTITVATRSTNLGPAAIQADSRAAASSLTIVTQMALERGTYNSSGKTILELCQSLRRHWGIGDLAGVSTSHPVDFGFSEDPSVDGVKLVAVTGTPSLDTRGPARLYLGSTTDDRVVDRTWEVMDTSGIEDLKRIGRLATSGNMEGAWPLLDHIIQSRGAETLNTVLEYLPRTIGGSIAHRYSGMDRAQSSGPVGSLNLYSHYMFNSDRVPGLSGSKDDKPFSFQAMYSYMLGVARFLKSPPPVLVALVDGTKLPTLVDMPVSLTSLPSSRSPLPQSPILRIDLVRLKQRHYIQADLPYMDLSVGSTEQVATALAAILVDCALSGQGSTLLADLLHKHTVKSVLGATELSQLSENDVLSASTQAVHTVMSDLAITNRFASKGFLEYLHPACELVAQALQGIAQLSALDTTRLGFIITRFGSTVGDTSRFEARLAMLTLKQVDTYCRSPPLLPVICGPDNHTGKSMIRRLSPVLITFGLGRYSLAHPSVESILYSRSIAAVYRFLYHKAEIYFPSLTAILGTVQKSLAAACRNPEEPNLLGLGVVTQCFRRHTWKILAENMVASVRKFRTIPAGPRINGRLTHVVSTQVVEDAGECAITQASFSPETMEVECPGSVVDTDSSIQRLRFSLPARMGLFVGPTTTIISRWVTVMAGLMAEYGIPSEQALGRVIGTGRGSIQVAMAHVGIPSLGYDLKEAVPLPVRASGKPAPMEAINCGVSDDAVYAQNPWVDWLEGRVSDSLSDISSIVVVDIETGATRHLKNLFIPFFSATPLEPCVVAVKVFANLSEIRALLSFLNNLNGLARLSYLGLGGCMCSTHASPILVAFKWVSTLTYSGRKYLRPILDPTANIKMVATLRDNNIQYQELIEKTLPPVCAPSMDDLLTLEQNIHEIGIRLGKEHVQIRHISTNPGPRASQLWRGVIICHELQELLGRIMRYPHRDRLDRAQDGVGWILSRVEKLLGESDRHPTLIRINKIRVQFLDKYGPAWISAILGITGPFPCYLVELFPEITFETLDFDVFQDDDDFGGGFGGGQWGD